MSTTSTAPTRPFAVTSIRSLRWRAGLASKALQRAAELSVPALAAAWAWTVRRLERVTPPPGPVHTRLTWTQRDEDVVSALEALRSAAVVDTSCR